jgi:PIN domain nuclease of toxin-antitoxin system
MAVCAVNHCEVAGKMIGWGSDESAIAATLGLMAYGIHPFDDLRAVLAARLRNSVKARSLSFGDRACLSLAMVTGLPVLTADRDWSALDLGIDVRLIR